MTTHYAAAPQPPDIVNILRRDLFLRSVYRANGLSDMQALVDSMGITDNEHRAAMLGLAKLAWLMLRRL